jgi:hypothetical protein
MRMGKRVRVAMLAGATLAGAIGLGAVAAGWSTASS